MKRDGVAEQAGGILGVDDLLGRYRADGQTESSGSFTLDPKKALERLAQFQLPGAYHWILKVVQSLHLSGASRVKIDAGINSVVVESDVSPKGFDCMDDLLTQLLADADQARPALRHLAAGLQGCLAVQPSLIEMVAVAEGERRAYVLKSGGWRDAGKEPAPPDEEWFVLRLTRNLSEKLGSSWFLLNTDIFDLVFRRRAALDREYKEVDRYCNYARCDVIAGTRSSNESRFGRPRFAGYEIRKDPNPASAKPSILKGLYEANLIEGVAHAHHHLVEMVVPSAEPGGFRLEPDSHATVTNRTDPDIVEAGRKYGLSRAYALRMDMAPLANLLFWEDGVILGSQTLPTDCRGLVALINARELGKDLTTLQVTDDHRLQKVFEEVHQAGEVLKKQVAENMHLMPAWDYLRRNLNIT